mgnify:CR=1 FL=1
MHNTHNREIYDFLASKILYGDLKKQREVLTFWADLIAEDFEQDMGAAGLDSDDKAYMQDTVEMWFYNTFLNFVCDLADAEEEAEALAKIKKTIQARVRGIIKDLLYERKTLRTQRQKKDKDLWKEKEQEPAASVSFVPSHQQRGSLRVSHLSPEIQETVFMDPYSDAETQYFYQEMIWEDEEQASDEELYAPMQRHDGGKSKDPASDDIGVFLAKTAHWETLQVRLANSRNKGSEA